MKHLLLLSFVFIFFLGCAARKPFINNQVLPTFSMESPSLITLPNATFNEIWWLEENTLFYFTFKNNYAEFENAYEVRLDEKTVTPLNNSEANQLYMRKAKLFTLQGESMGAGAKLVESLSKMSVGDKLEGKIYNNTGDDYYNYKATYQYKIKSKKDIMDGKPNEFADLYLTDPKSKTSYHVLSFKRQSIFGRPLQGLLSLIRVLRISPDKRYLLFGGFLVDIKNEKRTDPLFMNIPWQNSTLNPDWSKIAILTKENEQFVLRISDFNISHAVFK